jgi:hypothetical protein
MAALKTPANENEPRAVFAPLIPFKPAVGGRWPPSRRSPSVDGTGRRTWADFGKYSPYGVDLDRSFVGEPKSADAIGAGSNRGSSVRASGESKTMHQNRFSGVSNLQGVGPSEPGEPAGRWWTRHAAASPRSQCAQRARGLECCRDPNGRLRSSLPAAAPNPGNGARQSPESLRQRAAAGVCWRESRAAIRRAGVLLRWWNGLFKIPVIQIQGFVESRYVP